MKLPDVLASLVVRYLPNPPYLSELKREMRVCRVCEFALHVKSCTFIQILSGGECFEVCSGCLNDVTKKEEARALFERHPFCFTNGKFSLAGLELFRGERGEGSLQPQWKPLPGSRRPHIFNKTFVSAYFGDFTSWPPRIQQAFPGLLFHMKLTKATAEYEKAARAQNYGAMDDALTKSIAFSTALIEFLGGDTSSDPMVPSVIKIRSKLRAEQELMKTTQEVFDAFVQRMLVTLQGVVQEGDAGRMRVAIEDAKHVIRKVGCNFRHVDDTPRLKLKRSVRAAEEYADAIAAGSQAKRARKV